MSGRRDNSRRGCRLDGVLIVDKPANMTSHQLVQKVKRLLGAAKVGHGGTLDSYATGVMVLLLNGATKLSPYLSSHDKTYEFTAVFGVETDTDDATGNIVARAEPGPVDAEQINQACRQFVGEFAQQVPAYAAVRVGGRRLHELARRGEAVEPPRRRVTVKSLALRQLEWPRATFEVCCSKGTYVRSLVRDLGRALGCGAHVASLRRRQSGPFHLETAVSLQELQAAISKGAVAELIISPAAALAEFPPLQVSWRGAARLRQGQPLGEDDIAAAFLPGFEQYKALDPEGTLVALVTRRCEQGAAGRVESTRAIFRPTRVFGVAASAAASGMGTDPYRNTGERSTRRERSWD